MTNNLSRMRAGVAKWIAQARETNRIAGAKFLRGRVAFMEQQLAQLATLNEPDHLAGLTVTDLMQAQADLEKALRELET